MQKQEINDGHYLELMDRLHIVMSTISEHILEHPLTETDKRLEELVGNALTNLMDAYQYVGNMEQ